MGAPFDTLPLALELLAAHPSWYLFPLKRLDKDPPLIENNLVDASNDPKQMRAWHKLWPGCNWGVALKKSKLVVVDVDRKPGKTGDETFDALDLEYGFPDTYIVRSPSGGFHRYYNGEHVFALGKNGFGKDIDSPNYVVAPLCWTCYNSERGYDIINNIPVADAPDWFGVFLKPKEERDAEREDNAEPVVDTDQDPNVQRMIRYLQEGAPPSIGGSNGNMAMFNVACVLRENGLSELVACDLIERFYNVPGKCDPLWNRGVGSEKDRFDIVVRNAYRYGENKIGEATAEYAFGDDADAITKEEITNLQKSWDRRLAKQKRDKERKKVETSFANYDPITGEEIRDVQYDPITGEAFSDEPPASDDADPLDGESPEPDPPANPPKGGSKKQPPPDADTKAQGDAGGKTKAEQTKNWVRANWIWIVSMERFMRLTDGLMWSVKQFDSYYNNLATRGSFSNAMFSTDQIRKVERLVYRPGRGVFLENGKAINAWRPSTVVPADNQATISWKIGDETKTALATDVWNEHLNYLFQDPADKDRVLNWMAWVYQNLALKPNHGLLIVGRETGTGKSFIARVLEQLVGPDNTQRPKNTSLKGDFNAWLLKCKLCIIEELMQTGRQDVANELRDTITESTIEVNIKNITAQKIENFAAMMAITNHRNPIPMMETERRWLVVETFASKKDADYYNRLWPLLNSPDALAAIAYELKSRDLGKYTALLSPEETDARAQMISMSRPDVEQWMFENMGNPPLNRNLTTIQDVLDAMPATLQRQGRVRVAVQSFMRDKLQGVDLRAVRFNDGRRLRMWALNGRAVMLEGESDATLANLYEKERKASGSSLSEAEQAAADFED